MKPFSPLDQVLTKNERRKMKFLGINKILKPSAKTTSLERMYYKMLTDLGVDYIPQFPLGGRYYDAFLPDYNILFEFDGAFWHPLKTEDAKYGFQKKSMRVDEMKTKMAKERGYKFIRIRSDAPITIEQMRKMIWD